MSDEWAEVIPMFPVDSDAPVLTGKRPPWCQHKLTELNTESRRVFCRQCGREVDTFEAFLGFAREYEHWLTARNHMQKEAERVRVELEDLKRQVRNLKAQKRRLV